jgi:ribosomal protein L22|tara:strand:- start:1387 stop:1533 length:147 start_codon:yes stop_codon:yes gene_type:complete
MANKKKKIVKFIEHISNKNYAEAHKYLKSIIDDKITTRISKAAEKPLF